MELEQNKLLVSTCIHCKDAGNCDECPWLKAKGECPIEGRDWRDELLSICVESFLEIDVLKEEKDKLAAENERLIEENKNLSLGNESYKLKLDISTEMVEDLRGVLVAYREVGRDQALAIYRKDVYIAELKAKLEVLSPEEEEF